MQAALLGRPQESRDERGLQQRLSRLGHQGALRVPVVPGITDDAENVAAVCGFAAALPRLARVDLLAYHRTGVDKYRRLDRSYRLPDTEAPARERMEQIAATMAAAGLPVGRD